MWLIVQIAAGIVLAYILIRNGALVWRYSIGLLALFTAAAVLVFAGAFANEALASYGGFSGTAAKAFKLVGWAVAAVIYVLCLLAEGWAVQSIANRLFRREVVRGLGTFVAGFANFFLTGFALQGFDLSSNGPILGPIDDYSRSLGLERFPYRRCLAYR